MQPILEKSNTCCLVRNHRMPHVITLSFGGRSLTLNHIDVDSTAAVAPKMGVIESGAGRLGDQASALKRGLRTSRPLVVGHFGQRCWTQHVLQYTTTLESKIDNSNVLNSKA